jgi:hypothetical protein
VRGATTKMRADVGSVSRYPRLQALFPKPFWMVRWEGE